MEMDTQNVKRTAKKENGSKKKECVFERDTAMLTK